tara:strand:- start:145 stop:324 length:180 start_codon:yes stop_codon:yes gene_type:complete
MKQGDIVKFKGFDKYTVKRIYYGIIIQRKPLGRIDVLWGNGVIGSNLFEKSLEVVSEYR